MSRLRGWLAGGALISDGAWGTELQKIGLPPGQPPDLWNLDNPGAVREVARSYVEAGSEIILTNTFRANEIAMPECGRSRLAEVNRAGVELSRQAAGPGVRVVASLGPTGKLLMMGEVSADEIAEAYAAQAEALASAGPDALLLETFSDPEEAAFALPPLLDTGLPVILSFAFDSGKKHDRTMIGTSPEQVIVRFCNSSIDALGANCGAGVEHFAGVCRRLATCGIPVWVKANAGVPSSSTAGVSYPAQPAEFAAHLASLIEAGASFIGGCCGTSPDFIRALVAERNRLKG